MIKRNLERRLNMTIKNKKIEFAARRIPLTFNLTPRIAIYGSRSCGWDKWVFEFSWLLWGVGFMSKRLRSLTLLKNYILIFIYLKRQVNDYSSRF